MQRYRIKRGYKYWCLWLVNNWRLEAVIACFNSYEDALEHLLYLKEKEANAKQ